MFDFRFIMGLLASSLFFQGNAFALERQWNLQEVPIPVSLKLITIGNGFCLVEDESGTRFEVAGTSFSPADQEFLKILAQPPEKPTAILAQGPISIRRKDFKRNKVETLQNRFIIPDEKTETWLTGKSDVLKGASIHFVHPDGWLCFENLKPSQVVAKYLPQMLVNRLPAKLGKNIRVVPCGQGAIVIPHGPDFPALSLYTGTKGQGEEMACRIHVEYVRKRLTDHHSRAQSFLLKRGYMATLAANEDGTGFSRNYVAQDHDLLVNLPSELEGNVSFVRVFPWRWTGKKGIAGNIGGKLNLAWSYNWNISKSSTLDEEYVPIKQKKGWPSLKQNWQKRGSLHLLGFNEPDKAKQANMTVDAAIQGWKELLRTGLRLGSPATSDGGLNWLYQFIDRADREGLRVDFVVVHYYRAVDDPGDGRAAAAQFYRYLEQIHERTKRPLWIKEWNNGANWTKARDPKPEEQKRVIAAMVEMLEEAEFVERYALYNWVEPSRELVRKNGSLTPAGEAYRDATTTLSFEQP